MKRKKTFGEIFMITFSVLLAFMLNSWNETSADKNTAQLYLDGIFEEMDSNLVALESVLPYHNKLLLPIIKFTI